MLTALISLATFLYLIATSIVVLLKNPRKPLHISLAVSLIFFGMWLVGVAGLMTSLGLNIMYGRLIYVSAIVGLVSLYLFVYFFAESTKTTARWALKPRPASIVAGLLIVGSLSPFLVESVESAGEGKLPIPIFGPLYGFFVLWLAFTALSIAALLIKTYRFSSGKQRGQAKTILLGLCLFVAVAVTTNVILPQILSSRETAKLAPLSTAILAFSLSYAVLKQKFLNIRLIIARSLAYILLLSTMVGVYALLVFVFTDRLFGSESIFAQQVMLILIAIVLAFTTPFLKRFFDRVTNKIFYQDAYDPQAFLDQLNKTLVANIELGILLRHTSRVIEDNLKSNFCFVCVCETPNTSLRIIGADEPAIPPSTMKFIKSELPKFHQKTLVTDDIVHGHQKLKETLLSNEIAVIVRLASGYDPGQSSTIAYLVLGQKKSGNTYNKQDLRIIEIITDELVIAIQNALRFEEIAAFNITLQSRINQATEKLKATNEKLKELDQTKDEFLSMASHQLRTPLTSVKGYISMVLDNDAGPLNAQQAKLLQQALSSSQRMVYLIADLLNVSRLKTGKFVIEAKQTNLADLVASEVSQLKGAARDKHLHLTYHKPADFPPLLLDETKIRQVIMNFIDNAIYYTPAEGHIVVELTKDARYVYFIVRDDGLGVPLDEQPRLFTKFYRASNARKARPDGTGLGLFMAKRVVSAQGGQILFESNEGHGSVFGFKFPRKSTHIKQ